MITIDIFGVFKVIYQKKKLKCTYLHVRTLYDTNRSHFVTYNV